MKMAVNKDRSIEESYTSSAEPVREVIPPTSPAPELKAEIESEPVAQIYKETVEAIDWSDVSVKEVEVRAKKEETVAIGGQADERVVVGGPLRGTNLASDGTSYLFTGNGVCAIFKKHLSEFQARGCSEL